MSDDTEQLIWELTARGSYEEIRQFFTRGRTGGAISSRALPATKEPGRAMGSHDSKCHRSLDGLNQILVMEASGDPSTLLNLVRDHWALLRDKGLAEAQPVKIFSGSDNPGSIVYMFRWKTPESRSLASTDGEISQLMATIDANTVGSFPLMNEAYQGFECKQFPNRGGIELLRGKCTCMVKLDGIDEEFELDGQNGFVIMHRGPRTIQGDSRLMPVTILAHGAASPTASMGIMRRIALDRLRPPGAIGTQPGVGTPTDAAGRTIQPPAGMLAPNLLMSGTRGDTIRVEQNTELPQFGIIRALGPDSDFPATAMWVVHWRIHTPLGTVITDPNVPLEFGPTTVHLYPPVGTEFAAATGPVDIYHQDTNQVVGKLTPGELTAFDIVVTMDDEIPSAMDAPASYHVDMFNSIVGDAKQQISKEGIVDDYRVPASLQKSDSQT